MEFTDLTAIPEIYEETLIYLPYDDIMSVCRTHPDRSYICSDNRFWRRKVRRDFHVERLKPEGISYRQQYKDLITFNNPNRAAALGRLDILIVLKEKYNILPDEDGVRNAVFNNNLSVLKWLAEQGISLHVRDANIALHRRYLDILKWLKKQGIYPGEREVNAVIKKAVMDGDLDMLEFMKKEFDILPNEYIPALAASYGHLHILKWLAKQEIFLSVEDAYVAIEQAADYGDLDMIKWIKEEFDILPTEYIAEKAERYDHLHILEWLERQ